MAKVDSSFYIINFTLIYYTEMNSKKTIIIIIIYSNSQQINGQKHLINNIIVVDKIVNPYCCFIIST